MCFELFVGRLLFFWRFPKHLTNLESFSLLLFKCSHNPDPTPAPDYFFSKRLRLRLRLLVFLFSRLRLLVFLFRRLRLRLPSPDSLELLTTMDQSMESVWTVLQLLHLQTENYIINQTLEFLITWDQTPSRRGEGLSQGEETDDDRKHFLLLHFNISENTNLTI